VSNVTRLLLHRVYCAHKRAVHPANCSVHFFEQLVDCTKKMAVQFSESLPTYIIVQDFKLLQFSMKISEHFFNEKVFRKKWNCTNYVSCTIHFFLVKKLLMYK